MTSLAPCSRLDHSDKSTFTSRVLESGLEGFKPESDRSYSSTRAAQGRGVLRRPQTAKDLEVRPCAETTETPPDRRTRNACEGRPSWVCLPHATLFRKMIIPRGMVARGHDKDLRSFYLALRRRPSWWRSNVAGHVVKRSV